MKREKGGGGVEVAGQNAGFGPARSCEANFFQKKIEARKGSRASHKEGDYGVFTPFSAYEQASEGGEAFMLALASIKASF